MRSFELEFARVRSPDLPVIGRFEDLADEQYIQRLPGGKARPITVPWPRLRPDLQALRAGTADPNAVRRLGVELQRLLGDSNPVAAGIDAKGEARPVFVTLRFAAAELYALPWELYADSDTGLSWAGQPHVLVRYSWPATSTIPAARTGRDEDGRILVVWSAAGGDVPADRHIAAIERAAGPRFDRARDVLIHASSKQLVAQLERASAAGAAPISAVHILCHAGSSGLTLNADRGDAEVVDAIKLGHVFARFADRVRLVVLSSCSSGGGGRAGDALGSVAQEIHRVGVAGVIAARAPLSWNGSICLCETLYERLLGASTSLEDAFLAARAALFTGGRGLDWAALTLHARAEDDSPGGTRPLVERPYRGLLPFDREHARFFHGRDAVSDDVVRLLDERLAAGGARFVMVSGISGVGKSSVLRAGVLPRLLARKDPGWTYHVLSPSESPEAALALPRACTRPLLLIVDQLEERIDAHDAAAAQSLLARLWELSAQPDSGLSVVTTFHLAFTHHAARVVLDARTGLRLSDLIGDSRHHVLLGKLDPMSLTRAIEEPARRAGLELAAGLRERLLAAVGLDEGAQVRLEVVLDRLWERRAGSRLTHEALDALGDIGDVLGTHAETVMASLDAEQDLARRLFTWLVRPADREASPIEPIRRHASIDPLRPAGAPREFDRVVARLVRERLLTRDEDRLAIAHHQLIAGWARLRGWIRDDEQAIVLHDRIDALVHRWRLHGTLLTRNELAIVDPYSGPLAEDAVRLLAASRVQVRRQQRWRLLLSAAAVAAAAALVALGWISITNWQEAVQARAAVDVARAEGEVRSSEQRRAASLESAGDRHLEGREFTLAAMNFALALDVHETPELRGKLLRAMAEPAPELQWRVLESRVPRASVLSPDGSFLLGHDIDSFRRWGTRDGEVIETVPNTYDPGPVGQSTFALDPRGERIAVRHAARVDLVDVASGMLRSSHPLLDDEAERGPIAWSDDGERLVVATCREQSRKHDCVKPALLTLRGDDATPVRDVALEPVRHEDRALGMTALIPNHDGTRVAIVQHRGAVSIVDARGKNVVVLQPRDDWAEREPPTVIFDGDQTFLIGRDGGLVVVDAVTGETRAAPLAPEVAARMGSVSALLRLSDGDLVVAGCDGRQPGRRHFCQRGFLARVARDDGGPRWPSREIPQVPTHIVLDGGELVVLGPHNVDRIDAASGEPRALAFWPQGISTTGRERRSYPDALVLTHRSPGQIVVRVTDADTGELVAFASRAFDRAPLIELLPNKEMLVLDGSGTLFSLGEFGLGPRSELLTGVPTDVQWRDKDRQRDQPFAASVERFATVDQQLRLHVWSRRHAHLAGDTVAAFPTEMAIFDAHAAVLVAGTDGKVTQYDADTGVRVRDWDLAFTEPASITFDTTPHEGWIAVTNRQDGVVLLDVVHGERTDRAIDSGDEYSFFALSNDARWVARWPKTRSSSELLLFEDSPRSSRPVTVVHVPPFSAIKQLTSDGHELRIDTVWPETSIWSLPMPFFFPVPEHSVRLESSGEYAVWALNAPTVARMIAPFARLDRTIVLRYPPGREPSRVEHRRVEVAPGGRYVLSGSGSDVLLWDTRAPLGQVVRRLKRARMEDHLACDLDGEWCVYDEDERTLGVVRLGVPLAEAGRGPASARLEAPIRAVLGARAGRFLVQEGKHRLRVFSAPTDSLGAVLEAPTIIRGIHRASDDGFLVTLDTGAIHALTLDGDVVRLTPQPLLASRGKLFGTLPGRGLMVNMVSHQDAPTTWDIHAIRSGRRIASIVPLDMRPEIRGDDLWATQPAADRGPRRHDVRIPLELLEQPADVLAAEIARRYGLTADEKKVDRERSQRLAVVPVPDTYIID